MPDQGNNQVLQCASGLGMRADKKNVAFLARLSKSQRLWNRLSRAKGCSLGYAASHTQHQKPSPHKCSNLLVVLYIYSDHKSIIRIILLPPTTQNIHGLSIFLLRSFYETCYDNITCGALNSVENSHRVAY
jgi:hypothetical protein